MRELSVFAFNLGAAAGFYVLARSVWRGDVSVWNRILLVAVLAGDCVKCVLDAFLCAAGKK